MLKNVFITVVTIIKMQTQGKIQSAENRLVIVQIIVINLSFIFPLLRAESIKNYRLRLNTGKACTLTGLIITHISLNITWVRLNNAPVSLFMVMLPMMETVNKHNSLTKSTDYNLHFTPQSAFYPI